MEFSAKEMIKKRRSVRTFDEKPLTDEDRKDLENYIASVTNPFDIPVTFRYLDAKEYDISSPVLVGEKAYVGAKVKRTANCELGYGYSFEKFCLYALSRGIGTVMLALSIDRSACEKAMDVQPDEMMPVASPVGYPAEKMSIREGMMRKGLKADQRKSFDGIFFRKSFAEGLKPEDAGVFKEALEAARWAASASNAQPWRAVVDGDAVHFYKALPKVRFAHWDAEALDVGIALAHFDLVLQEDGINGSFVFEDPGIAVPENIEYAVTYRKA